MNDPRELLSRLAAPFAAEDLEWRLQIAYEDRMQGIAVPYVTNRRSRTVWMTSWALTAGIMSSSRGTAQANGSHSFAASPSISRSVAGSPKGRRRGLGH